MKIIKFRQAYKNLKSLDYRHYINFVITLGFLTLGVFVFPNSILRLAETFRNLGRGDVSARAYLTGVSVKLGFELHYFTSMIEASHISGAL